MKILYKNISKVKFLLYGGLGLVFFYYLTGIFPITRFETDSMAIANACEEMIQSGKFEENILGHSYHMQSGTYFLIITTAKTFNISTFASYSVLTIVFAFIYWIFLFLIIKGITNANPALIIIILLLFQEIFILSYYANSAIIASAFWIVSFYILWKRNDNTSLIISALLLSLAMWFRVDVAFTFPSVLLLFYMKNKKIIPAIIRSAILAAVVIPLTILLMYLMNADVAGFLGYTEYHGELFGTEHNIGLLDLEVIKAHAAYFSALILFLIISGIIILITTKNLIPVFFLITGIFFYYLLGINNTVAPKHLSYFTLFWAIIIIYGVNYYKEIQPLLRKLMISLIIFLFFIQYIVGMRVEIGSIPYQFENRAILNPEPTLLSLGIIKLNKSSVQNIYFVLGPGTKISTSDELSASSGLIFSPIMWYKQKEGLYHSFNKLTSILKYSKNDTVYLNAADGSSQFVINNLLTNSFIWKEKEIDLSSDVQSLTFERDSGPPVLVHRYSVNKSNIEVLIKRIYDYKSNSSYYVFIWDWQNYYLQKMESPFIQNVTYQIHRVSPVE